MKISRKKFISDSFVLSAGSFLLQSFSSDDETVMTVNGPLSSQKMGFTLTHEHIMADFCRPCLPFREEQYTETYFR